MLNKLYVGAAFLGIFGVSFVFTHLGMAKDLVTALGISMIATVFYMAIRHPHEPVDKTHHDENKKKEEDDERVDTLINCAQNDRKIYESVAFTSRCLRYLVDALADRAAREAAEWHDDPKHKGYAMAHAPADAQFPREVRDEAVLELIRIHLFDITAAEEAP